MSTQGKADKNAIAETVSDKMDVSTDKVLEAVQFQFLYVAQVMKAGDFRSVRLPYFGIFNVKEGRVEALEEASSEDN